MRVDCELFVLVLVLGISAVFEHEDDDDDEDERRCAFSKQALREIADKSGHLR